MKRAQELPRRENADPFRLDLEHFHRAGEAGDDRVVAALGTHLCGKHIALVVTGSIAAYKAPELARMIRRYGGEVSVYLTKDAAKLVSAEALRWAVGNVGAVYADALSGNVEHLTTREGKRYDGYLVCPATYNILNKVAHGVADEPASTLLAAALGRLERLGAPLLFVPTMNGDMLTSVLAGSLRVLEGAGAYLVRPRTTHGKWELPDTHEIVLALCRKLSKSVLSNRAILLTAGPTPVRLDRVRVVTNLFRGALGIALAEELVARGANVRFLFGGDPQRLPPYLRGVTVPYRDFDEYLSRVVENVRDGNLDGATYVAGIFSAAVADYRPETVFDGKISSGVGEGIVLPRFIPTPKVIDRVRDLAPALPMITFKLMANVSEEQLLTEARRRLAKFQFIIANRLEDLGRDGNSLRYLVSRDGEERFCGDNRALAAKILDMLESYVKANATFSRT